MDFVVTCISLRSSGLISVQGSVYASVFPYNFPETSCYDLYHKRQLQYLILRLKHYTAAIFVWFRQAHPLILQKRYGDLS